MEEGRVGTFSKEIHILVVDDEESIRRILKSGIEGAGYRCSLAEDGVEALEILEKDPADVVVTDIKMPRMDGIALTRKVRQGHGADVIVMTGFVEDFTYDGVVEIGASDFVEKPVGIKEFVARLRRVLKERSTRAERDQAEERLWESIRRLQRVMESVVESMSVAVEKRDLYTAGHQKQVAALADGIARKMNLADEEVTGIRLAAYVHDIGKISVPAEILGKAGRLSDQEMAIIKNHPEEGYEVLKGIDFPWPVAEMVRQHHERIDGSGYPQGLKGEEICLGARILAVADVVDAMSSHRPYRPSLGLEAALDEIQKGRGERYGAEVCDACIRLFREKGFRFGILDTGKTNLPAGKSPLTCY